MMFQTEISVRGFGLAPCRGSHRRAGYALAWLHALSRAGAARRHTRPPGAVYQIFSEIGGTRSFREGNARGLRAVLGPQGHSRRPGSPCAMPCPTTASRSWAGPQSSALTHAAFCRTPGPLLDHHFAVSADKAAVSLAVTLENEAIRPHVEWPIRRPPAAVSNTGDRSAFLDIITVGKDSDLARLAARHQRPVSAEMYRFFPCRRLPTPDVRQSMKPWRRKVLELLRWG